MINFPKELLQIMEKRPLLLLHAALGSKQQLEPLAQLLSDRFQIYSLDFEGHGDFNSEAIFSIERFADNTLAFLQEHQLEKVDIFGYSMGGYVALHLAQNHPGKVGNIFTFGTKLDWTVEAAERETKMLNPEVIAAKVPHFAEKLRQVHSGNDWKSVLHRTAAMMRNLAAGEKLSDHDFNQIQHRVLITVGAIDKMVSVKESEHVAGQLGNAECRVIEGFQHAIEKNDTRALANMVSAFVNQV